MITDHTGQIGRHMYHISHLLQRRLCTYMYKGVHKIAGSWTWNIHVTFNRTVTSYHPDCVLRKIIALFRKNQHFKTSNTRDSDCTETKKSSALQAGNDASPEYPKVNNSWQHSYILINTAFFYWIWCTQVLVYTQASCRC